MENFKKWVMSISLVSLMIVVYSCSSDDSFIDEMETYEIASRSVTPSLDTILNSPEFQNLDKAYTELISIIRNSVENLTQDEIDEFSELFLLCTTDSLKYTSLCNYQIRNVIFKDNYEYATKIFDSVLESKNKLLANDSYKRYIGNNDSFITYILLRNAGITMQIDNSMKRMKTRSEEDVQKCLELCKESYELAIANAFELLMCATAVNIAVCVTTLGVNVGGLLLAEVGIYAAYYNAIEAAEGQYEICKKGCN